VLKIDVQGEGMSEEENPQEVLLIPVDDEDQILLYSDVKIEKVDDSYRTVSDPKGLPLKLSPGEYNVKIFLRTLEMRTVPLTVSPGVSVYKVCVENKDKKKARAMSQPVPRAINETSAPAIVSRHESSSVEKRSGKRLEDQSAIEPRHNTSIPVSYRVGAGQWLNSKSVNLSTTGVCIESMGQVGSEDTLYVRLHVPVSSVPIECPARVVWVKIKDVPRPRMGLQLYLTDNMRTSINNWLTLIKRPE
jgi:hypothetical protein